jgi:hypothetical protein
VNVRFWRKADVDGSVTTSAFRRKADTERAKLIRVAWPPLQGRSPSPVILRPEAARVPPPKFIRNAYGRGLERNGGLVRFDLGLWLLMRRVPLHAISIGLPENSLLKIGVIAIHSRVLHALLGYRSAFCRR